MIRNCLLSFSVLFVGLLLAEQAAASDWPTSRGNNGRTGVAADAVNVNDWNELWVWRSSHPPQVAWAGPAKWDAYANILNLPNMRDYDRCFGVIAVGDRVWLASSADDSVYCLSAKSGEVLWSHTAEGPIRMAPTFDTGRIYFGDDSGAATCLHAESGDVIWKHQAPTTRSAMIHNGRFISALPCRTGVLVHNDVAWFAFGMLPWQDAYLCAVDASTGKIETKAHYQKKISGATFEGPLAVAGHLLVSCQGRVPPKIFELASGTDRGSLATGGGGAGGSFVSITATGDILHGPGNKAARIIRTQPGAAKPIASYANCKRIVATTAGMVLAGDAGLQLVNDQGKSIWQQTTEPRSEIIVAGKTIIAGGENEVAAFQLADGTPIWRRPVTGNACDLAICDSRLLVSTDAGAIHCFAASAKGSRETVVAKDDIEATPVIRPQPAAAEPTRGLLSHWVFELGMEERARRRGLANPERFVSDRKHQNDAAMTGPLEIREAGAAQALVFNGRASVLVADDVAKMKLPEEAITVAAWVRVDQPSAWGGFVGFMQDNGSFERGWVLGLKDDRFTFALKSESGNGALTYLAAKKPYVKRRWHHVVGVYDGKSQRIFVDGELAGESAAQKGAIDYPKSGYFEIGAYHDDNEQYFLNGQIHAIALHTEALTADEVAAAYNAKAGWFPQPTRLAAGPWWRFEPGGEATVEWRTALPSPSILKTTIGKVEPSNDLATPKTEHLARLKELPAHAVGSLQIETRVATGIGVTPEFDFDTHFDRSVPPVSLKAAEDEATIAAIQSFRKQAGVNRGIALFIGAQQASLAEELIRQTEFRVLLLVANDQQLSAIRNRWKSLNVYGVRASARLLADDTFDRLPKGCFNLAAAEAKLVPETISSDALAKFAIAGRGWSATANVNRASDWQLTKRPTATGAGTWTHQYGSAGNSAFGGESLGGVSRADDLEVRWMGRPGPRMQPDRSGRKPSPLAGGGRLYIQGMHRMAAVDAANGTLLWGLEIPAFERFNIPRDSGNWCCDENNLYAAVGGDAWKIDGETGEIKSQQPVVCSDSAAAPYDWSYIARASDHKQQPHLIGSAVKQGTAYTNFWGGAAAGWYDARSGPATYKICSENIFSLNPATGSKNWERQSGLIINPTITIDAGHVYFVEARYPSLKTEPTRRFGSDDFWKDQYLVSLNLATGEVEWEKPLNVERGVVVFYLAAADGKLVITTSNNQKYAVYGYDAKTGDEQWRQSFSWPGGAGDHGKAMSRPAIVGGKVYVRPRAMDLATGELLKQTVPLGGCGTYAATETALIFRQHAISMWSTEANAVTKWNRLRPGCWLSTVPACGMVLSPEAGGGCSCGQWLEASIGFSPK